jgi:hypothetical protein
MASRGIPSAIIVGASRKAAPLTPHARKVSDMEPQYRHYCDGSGGHTCQYLGPYKWAEVEYDLYYHGGDHPALYVRWGDGAETEGMPATATTIPDYAQGGKGYS